MKGCLKNISLIKIKYKLYILKQEVYEAQIIYMQSSQQSIGYLTKLILAIRKVGMIDGKKYEHKMYKFHKGVNKYIITT